MKFMLVGDWTGSTIEEVGGRFANGEHSAPPEPCKVITRWHDPSSKLFWLVVETPDAATLQEWMSRWTDIINWNTFPVMDDQEVGEVLARLL